LLGTFCTTSFSRFSYITILAPLAYDSSLISVKNTAETDDFDSSSIDTWVTSY